MYQHMYSLYYCSYILPNIKENQGKMLDFLPKLRAVWQAHAFTEPSFKSAGTRLTCYFTTWSFHIRHGPKEYRELMSQKERFLLAYCYPNPPRILPKVNEVSITYTRKNPWDKQASSVRHAIHTHGVDYY